MKKLLLLITGTLLIAATAQANCGSCEGKGAAAKDKAACEMKKAECGKDKAACEMKKAECGKDKAACEMKKAECGKDKAACETEKKGVFQKMMFWK